jgi:hypothetical protein
MLGLATKVIRRMSVQSILVVSWIQRRHCLLGEGEEEGVMDHAIDALALRLVGLQYHPGQEAAHRMGRQPVACIMAAMVAPRGGVSSVDGGSYPCLASLN